MKVTHSGRYGIFLFLVLLGLITLSACAEREVALPKVFGGNEVPADVLAKPRVVPVPPSVTSDTPWPRLGDVPSKPMDFTPQPTIDAARNQMDMDRDEALRLQQNYEAAQQPATLPLWGEGRVGGEAVDQGELQR